MRTIVATLIAAFLMFQACYAQETEKKEFKVFSYDPQLIEAGAENYRLATGHYWFARKDGKYLLDEPSPARTRKFLPAGSTSPVVIDIEHWPLNDATRDDLYRKMKIAVGAAREVDASYKFGWYAFLPIRNYWTPVLKATTDASYREWQRNNRENMEKFGHLFDFLCPSLYTFYESHTFDQWAKYADANLQECVYAKKKNYAFIWAEFHSSEKPGAGVPIPDDLWRKQLAFLRDHEHCHGVFVFAGPKKGNWRQILIDELLSP